MCDCYSTNGDHGTVPNVVLTPPERFHATRDVAVDACIAPVIEALWAAGIWTRGCCCGHGGPGRSVCVENHNRAAAAKVVRGMGDTAKILAYELVGGDTLPEGVRWRHDAPHLWATPEPLARLKAQVLEKANDALEGRQVTATSMAVKAAFASVLDLIDALPAPQSPADAPPAPPNYDDPSTWAKGVPNEPEPRPEPVTLPRWRCRQCGCLWRDNLDGSVSLFDAEQKSCRDCEGLPVAEACEVEWFKSHAESVRAPAPPAPEPPLDDERMIEQFVRDLYSAHAEIVKLQGGDPEKFDWPEWSGPANSIRWAEKRLGKSLSKVKSPAPEPDATPEKVGGLGADGCSCAVTLVEDCPLHGATPDEGRTALPFDQRVRHLLLSATNDDDLWVAQVAVGARRMELAAGKDAPWKGRICQYTQAKRCTRENYQCEFPSCLRPSPPEGPREE